MVSSTDYIFPDLGPILFKGIFEAFWLIFTSSWQIWFLLIAIIFIRIFFERVLPGWINSQRNHIRFVQGEKWRSDRDLTRQLRGMQPSEFEGYIADLFLRLGYKTEAVGGSHDGGIDIIAEKDGIKHYIQCKKFITREVGVGAVRDFYGAIADHLAQGKGYFITTNKFTLEAEKFAEDKPIELIDGQKLVKYIKWAEKESSESKESECPQCGGKFVEREGKFGKFYGCSNYPRCRFTKNINR